MRNHKWIKSRNNLSKCAHCGAACSFDDPMPSDYVGVVFGSYIVVRKFESDYVGYRCEEVELHRMITG